MEGKHVRVSVENVPPYVALVEKNGRASLRGYLGKVWKILQKRLGFTSEIVEEKFRDGVFYSRAGLRDVILHPSAIASSDLDEFDFTVPVLRSWYSLYVKDSDEVNSSASFIRNWSAGLWASTAIMVLTFTFFFYILLNLSHRFLRMYYAARGTSHRRAGLAASSRRFAPGFTRGHESRTSNEGSLGNCFIIALAAFCSQGHDLTSRIASIRILMLTVLIFGMIMRNSYSALLVSQLTLRERFLPFASLDEIPIEAREYSLCVRNDSFPYSFFKVNDGTRALKRRWNGIVNRRPCVAGVVPADVMCAHNVAFLETPAIMQESISKNFKCKITRLRKRYYETDFSILLVRGFNSAGQREINSEIIKYREVGILRHLIKRHVGQDELRSPADDPVLQVTYDHIKGVLLAYFSCLGVSLVLFIVEICANQTSQHVLAQTTRRRRRISVVTRFRL